MEYRAELERVAAYFQSVPGRLNKANLKHLVALNHFETFEDTLPDGGVRLSLSGSIVVIDVDFVNGQVTAVSVSLASMPADHSRYSFMAKDNNSDGVILSSLGRPRLDQFVLILEFLSRCDRFSTKDVDCFRALDYLGSSICTYVSNSMEPDVTKGFGVPEINPGRLGLGLWYFGDEDQKHYAFIDTCAGSRREFALYTNENWLNEAGDWADLDKEELTPRDVRAELVLLLDPPVYIQKSAATRFSAETSDKQVPFNERRQMSTFTVNRHPAFAAQQASDDIDVVIANLLPYDFVEVTSIPISDPRNIPDILSALRRDCRLFTLINSVLKGPALSHSTEVDLSIADALDFKDKPISFNSVSVNLSVQQREGDCLALKGLVGQSGISFEIWIRDEIEFKLKGDVKNQGVMQEDLTKILKTGKLDYAISYVVGSLKLSQRRGSVSR